MGVEFGGAGSGSDGDGDVGIGRGIEETGGETSAVGLAHEMKDGG